MQNAMTTRREDLARLAAYIDGEGFIGIKKVRRREMRRAVQYRLEVNVANTDPRLAIWLREKFSGSIKCNIASGKRPIYVWSVGPIVGGKLLRECYEFLVIKKEQADLAFEFRATFDDENPDKRGVADDILDRREELKNLLSIEKKRVSAA